MDVHEHFVHHGFNICRKIADAITKHEWDKLLDFLPLFVSYYSASASFPYYTIWKILHHVFLNVDVPVRVKRQLVADFILSPNSFALIGIEQLFQEPADEEQVENFHKLATVRHVNTFSHIYPFTVYEASYALYNYMILQKPIETDVQNRSLKGANSSLATSQAKPNDVSVYKELLRTFNQYTHLAKAVTNRPKEYHQLVDLHGLCEWLLGPLLHMHNVVERKYDGEHTTAGLDIRIVDYYTEKNPQNIPGLRLAAKYFLSYHPKKKSTIYKLLQKISQMSPSDALVLQYVKLLTKDGRMAIPIKEDQDDTNDKYGTVSSDIEDINDLSDDFGLEIKIKKKGRKEKFTTVPCNETTDKKACSLKDQSVNAIILRIGLLTNLLEYDCWREATKPWRLLSIALKQLYTAWASCWECDKCLISRWKISKVSKQLFLWPAMFWRQGVAQNTTIKGATIAVHRAFSAFVLNYDKKFLRRIRDNLPNDKLITALNMLIFSDGDHVQKCLEFFKSMSEKIMANINMNPGLADQFGENPHLMRLVFTSITSVENSCSSSESLTTTSPPEKNRKSPQAGKNTLPSKTKRKLSSGEAPTYRPYKKK